MKIAVLLTTFNRAEKTIMCLKSLKQQQLANNVATDVFLTDDASSDDTVKAVTDLYPGIHIFNGSGNLYWAGGMRMSWRQSLKNNYDFYLLLNDDTVLAANAIAILLKCNDDVFKNTGLRPVCVGSTFDRQNGLITYGGKLLKSRFSGKSNMVYSKDQYLDCDLGNANIMLIPNEIVQTIGILSSQYTHGIADYDYTLRAKKAGFRVVVAPGEVGYCVDDHGNNWQPQTARLTDRIAYLKSPTGLAYKEYLIYIKTHFPLYYPLAYAKLWLKTLLPVFWTLLKR